MSREVSGRPISAFSRSVVERFTWGITSQLSDFVFLSAVCGSDFEGKSDRLQSEKIMFNPKRKQKPKVLGMNVRTKGRKREVLRFVFAPSSMPTVEEFFAALAVGRPVRTREGRAG